MTEVWTAPDEGAETGAEIDVVAGLKLQVGRLSDKLDREEQRARRRARLVPGDIDVYGSGAFPASGVLVLPLGQPSLGRVWEVRNWNCSGVAWSTVAAGSAVIGATAAYGKLHGGASSTATQAVGSEVQDALTTLPGVHQIGTRQIVVLPGETLAVVVIGGTATQTYSAHAYVLDYPLDAELGAPGGAI